MSDSLQVTGSFSIVPSRHLNEKITKEIAGYFVADPDLVKWPNGDRPFWDCPWRMHSDQPVVGLADPDCDIGAAFLWLDLICDDMRRKYPVRLAGFLLYSQRNNLVNTGYIRIKQGRPVWVALGTQVTLPEFDDWFFEYQD